MKRILRNTVAAPALLCLVSGAALAQGTNNTVTAADGRFILPHHGDIDPFHGDINPFYGDINPFYGDISPFWGDISPFWGDIDPFHGDINPFFGDINPFWGDIDPFYGDINPFYGDIDPFFGDIAPFWGDIGPFWGDINAFWGDIDPFTGENATDYSTLTGNIQSLFDQAESVFGAAYEASTGRTFSDGFQAVLLERYGIDLSDPASLENVTAQQRSAFFLAFYDGLMSYSGVDHVDHWMSTINWSPALSQAAGGGDRVVVGMLDFSITNVQDLNLRLSGGETDYLDFNHGSAVAGLIAAPVDGHGVMGLAPDSTLITYNPFDESLSTNWMDVRDGMVRLTHQGARILNMSLGMPGWTLHQDWANIFNDRSIKRRGYNTLYVIAAGNEGVTQTADLDWSGVRFTDNMLIVGSVDPNGNISSFSNRPGTACLLTHGDHCHEGDRLMDRFLVAPGEMILVSDGVGGVVRQSGTSFAAPMVSGAAALVQGRWNWLRARDVADVLLLSAQDLGDPGVDAVYGHGLLDVNAAMSPLDSQNLFAIDRRRRHVAVSDIRINPGRLQFRYQSDATITLFERINSNVRDFVVSLDDVLLGSEASIDASERRAETYLLERTSSSRRRGGRRGGRHFTDIDSFERTLAVRGNLEVTAMVSASDPLNLSATDALPFQASFNLTDTATGREVQLGMGEGALALSAQEGFGMFSDHRPETGGVNPVLGFASGGAYVMSSLRVGEDTSVSFGVTSTREEDMFVMPFSGEEYAAHNGMSPYEAYAFLADIRHELSNQFSVHASYTHLYEQTGVLGAQGSGALSFEGGAQTSALTFGADVQLPFGFDVSSSATYAVTAATQFDGDIFALPEDIASTSFQLSMNRGGILKKRDGLRLSVIQPLHVEGGHLSYDAMHVTDRETGDIGAQTQQWELGGTRALFAEILYAAPVFDGRGELSVFARSELTEGIVNQDVAGLASGVRFDIKF
jgi:hypothetical protein